MRSRDQTPWLGTILRVHRNAIDLNYLKNLRTSVEHILKIQDCVRGGIGNAEEFPLTGFHLQYCRHKCVRARVRGRRDGNEVQRNIPRGNVALGWRVCGHILVPYNQQALAKFANRRLHVFDAFHDDRP